MKCLILLFTALLILVGCSTREVPAEAATQPEKPAKHVVLRWVHKGNGDCEIQVAHDGTQQLRIAFLEYRIRVAPSVLSVTQSRPLGDMRPGTDELVAISSPADKVTGLQVVEWKELRPGSTDRLPVIPSDGP